MAGRVGVVAALTASIVTLSVLDNHRLETDTIPVTAAFLSLGSNVGDRLANIQSAISCLGPLGRIVAVSSIYETEPVELTEQPWFLNCVVRLGHKETSGATAC